MYISITNVSINSSFVAGQGASSRFFANSSVQYIVYVFEIGTKNTVPIDIFQNKDDFSAKVKIYFSNQNEIR